MNEGLPPSSLPHVLTTLWSVEEELDLLQAGFGGGLYCYAGYFLPDPQDPLSTLLYSPGRSTHDLAQSA